MNQQSRAIADLVYAAARTAPGRRADDMGIVASALISLVGPREAEKLRAVNVGSLALMSREQLRECGLSAEAASTLRAAFKEAVKELNEAPLGSAKIDGPAAVDELMRDRVALLPYEEVWVLFLNKNHVVKADLRVSRSGFNPANVDGRTILAGALEIRAAGFVLVHNHTSGSPAPTTADLGLTRQIAEQGRVMQTPLVDHIIIARGGLVSLKQEGLV